MKAKTKLFLTSLAGYAGMLAGFWGLGLLSWWGVLFICGLYFWHTASVYLTLVNVTEKIGAALVEEAEKREKTTFNTYYGPRGGDHAAP
jgi:hypothetical protein